MKKLSFDERRYWIVADIYGVTYLNERRFDSHLEALEAARTLPEYNARPSWERPTAHLWTLP